MYIVSCPSTHFLKKLNVLEAGYVSIFRKGDHADQAILSDWVP